MQETTVRQTKEIKELFSTPKKVVITTHHKPDADALGSSLALGNFLKKKGHEVKVIVPSDYPNFLNWMAGNADVLIFDLAKPEIADSYIKVADIICCLDFNAYNRINELADLVKPSKAKKLLVDHHLDPEKFADYYFWDNKAAATAELIYELIDAMGEKALIDKDIAEAIYAGIMTDTGSFRFPSTSSKIHHIIAELISIGADNSKVHRLVFDKNSENRLRFIGFALSQRLCVLPEYHLAYFAISAEDLKQFDSRTGDTEGLVNYGLSIEGVVFATVIIEREDAVKLSLRSAGDFSVQEFASKHFFGGGHKNASGGRSDLNLKETEEKFLSLLPQYKEKLDTVYHSESL